MFTFLQVLSASARSILCNNTTKNLLKELSLSDVIQVFVIACTSNPFIISACLLDMVLGYFFGLRDYYENKMVWACMPFKHT